MRVRDRSDKIMNPANSRMCRTPASMYRGLPVLSEPVHEHQADALPDVRQTMIGIIFLRSSIRGTL